MLTLSFLSSILSSTQLPSQHDRLFALLLPYIARVDPQLHRNLRLLPTLNQYSARSNSLILNYCAQTLITPFHERSNLQGIGIGAAHALGQTILTRTNLKPTRRIQPLDMCAA
jgi:hypothetical protein